MRLDLGRLELLGALGREREARESEARQGRELRRIREISPEIIATVGPGHLQVGESGAVEKILGYKPAELVVSSVGVVGTAGSGVRAYPPCPGNRNGESLGQKNTNTQKQAMTSTTLVSS